MCNDQQELLFLCAKLLKNRQLKQHEVKTSYYELYTRVYMQQMYSSKKLVVVLISTATFNVARRRSHNSNGCEGIVFCLQDQVFHSLYTCQETIAPCLDNIESGRARKFNKIAEHCELLDGLVHNLSSI